MHILFALLLLPILARAQSSLPPVLRRAAAAPPTAVARIAGRPVAPVNSETARRAVAAPPFLTWSAGRPLTVDDFRGRPGAGEKHAALTSTTIDARGGCHGSLSSAEVRAVFDPTTSWVREPATITEGLLRHEQLHFDLAELYARLLRLRLAAAKTPCAQFKDTFSRISRTLYAEWEREQNRYDQETRHGLDAARQVFWERQTTVRLHQLAAYALKERA